MKFGIFFELSTPRPFGAGAEQRVYDNALEQARVADQLGFDWVWAVEHHFLEEYSHCSAPEVVLAAVAAQTERIRVGHGAVVCVPEMNHPIRVAERAAALDLISGGRLEFGTARSSTWTELGGFNVDPDDTKKTWDEFVRVLPHMWSDEPFAHEGVCFSMPERNVLPKPVQKPHPPMWVTVTTPGTELDAAERGLGCLGVAAASYKEQERRTAEYHRRVRQCDPISSVVNDQVTTLNFLYCHEDPAKAAATGMGLVGAFALTNSHQLWTREAYPTRAYQSLGNLAPSGAGPADRSGPGDPHGIPEGICVGDPDRIAGVIERWDSIGITGINFLVNALECVPQAEVLDSLRLFASEVLPAVQHDMLTGTADVEVLAKHAPHMAGFDADTLVLADAEVLQAGFEMRYSSRQSVLPPALHPNTPPTMVILAWRCRQSPWGPFQMAQVRVGCRSGVRPRGFVVSSVVDNDSAATALSASYGLPMQMGKVELTRRYDRVGLRVELDTGPALDLDGANPDPLGVGDVQYSVTMTLAHTPRGLRLVQVEPEYETSRVERLRPRLHSFEASAWDQPLLTAVHPMAASLAVATITVPPLRYVCRPDVLAFEGTESVR